MSNMLWLYFYDYPFILTLLAILRRRLVFEVKDGCQMLTGKNTLASVTLGCIA